MTANRLQLSGKRESALAFLDAQARLARLLLELEAKEQDKGYVTISQEELAHHTGLIRQTVAKALGKWRRVAGDQFLGDGDHGHRIFAVVVHTAGDPVHRSFGLFQCALLHRSARDRAARHAA
ncbi:MAG: hypothetical protein CUN53_18760 [Phototrophicales bacterium]|nr:MAG: hypothetical protein CUN53_18760 [Phototrophicales bacterium]